MLSMNVAIISSKSIMKIVIQAVILGNLFFLSPKRSPCFAVPSTIPASSIIDGLALEIHPENFIKVNKYSGEQNYYSVESGIIRATYNPSMKIVKLGYQLPDTLNNVKRVSWDWRIITPPRGSNEKLKDKNDSGAAVYLVFGDKIRTQIIKYVYSETLSTGTILKKDPFPPLQRMFIKVTNSLSNIPAGNWAHVDIDIKSDFITLFEADTCPSLKAIGIMSDGDETGSTVIAEYRNIILYKSE